MRTPGGRLSAKRLNRVPHTVATCATHIHVLIVMVHDIQIFKKPCTVVALTDDPDFVAETGWGDRQRRRGFLEPTTHPQS